MAQCAKVAKSHTQRQTEANTKANELKMGCIDCQLVAMWLLVS
jgi:hypothetical protein